MNDDAATQDILRKIDREKAIINGLNQMRQATNNASVNSRVESQIRDARRNIQYFEQTLQDLRSRKIGSDMGNLSLRGSGRPQPQSPGGPSNGMSGRGMNNQQGYGGGEADYGNPGPGGYSEGGAPGLMPPRAPFTSAPTDRSPKRPTFSRLGKSTLLHCVLKKLRMLT